MATAVCEDDFCNDPAQVVITKKAATKNVCRDCAEEVYKAFDWDIDGEKEA